MVSRQSSGSASASLVWCHAALAVEPRTVRRRVGPRLRGRRHESNSMFSRYACSGCMISLRDRLASAPTGPLNETHRFRRYSTTRPDRRHLRDEILRGAIPPGQALRQERPAQNPKGAPLATSLPALSVCRDALRALDPHSAHNSRGVARLRGGSL